MVAWRSPELEAIFGGPADETTLSESSIRQLVHDAIRETEQLDFKGTMYGVARGPRPHWTDEQEFAKDVAAFANHRGGMILIGVTELNDMATALSPVTGVPFASETQRLRQALVNYLAPIAPTSYIEVQSAGGGWYMAVVVPPSPRSPHAVMGPTGDLKRPLRYPVRHGTDTTWLTESEVSERYRRRFGVEAAHRSIVEGVVDEGCEALQTAEGVWLYLAVVPDLPIVATLDSSAVRTADEWLHRNLLNGPLGGYVGATGRAIPGPGKVTFTGSRRLDTEDEASVRDGYVELYLSGAAFAATPVGERTAGEAARTGVGEFTLVEDIILVNDLALRWAAHQAGAWGAAVVVAGFFDATEAPTPPSRKCRPLTLVSSHHGGLRQMRGTRTVTQAPRATTAADLAAVDTVQQRLGVAHNVAAGLLQWFGLAEPTQLRHDGSVVIREWGMSQYRRVEQWANGYGVECERLPEA